jgi:hypothetical protein
MEKWKQIVDWPYEVSSRGRVRRSVGNSGTRKGLVIKLQINHGGYPVVVLHHKERMKGVTVHRLVAAAFIGPKPDGLQVNHKDGDKQNNLVYNLEYVTPSENLRHSYGLGLQVPKRGEKSNLAKLTSDKVLEIRKMVEDGWYQKRIAERFRIDQSTVSNIITGKSWGHLK